MTSIGDSPPARSNLREQANTLVRCEQSVASRHSRHDRIVPDFLKQKRCIRLSTGCDRMRSTLVSCCEPMGLDPGRTSARRRLKGNLRMVNIDNILASLYATGINTSLAWKTYRGFKATLGTPPLASAWFQTSGEAARWLKEQALVHFPGAEFAPERNQVHSDAEALLDDLYASKIDGSISWIWDSGFYVSLDALKAEAEALESVAEALEWLRGEACQGYPQSDFTRNYCGFV